MNMSRVSCFRGQRYAEGKGTEWKGLRVSVACQLIQYQGNRDIVPGNGHVIPACEAQCVGLFVKCTTYGHLRMVLCMRVCVCMCPHAVAHSHTSDVLIVAGGLQSGRETQRDWWACSGAVEANGSMRTGAEKQATAHWGRCTITDKKNKVWLILKSYSAPAAFSLSPTFPSTLTRRLMHTVIFAVKPSMSRILGMGLSGYFLCVWFFWCLPSLQEMKYWFDHSLVASLYSRQGSQSHGKLGNVRQFNWDL